MVVGYADPAGTPAAGAQLAKLRAQVVSDQLVQDGVPLARIQQSSTGTTGFAGSAQESRRAEIDVGN